jgi:ribosome-binding factor A
MSPDLKNATVFVTPLGGGDPKAAVRALERNKRWIRGQVAHKVNLRYAPDLVFRFDDRFEESARIDALLRSPDVTRDLAGRRDDGGDED